MQQEGERVCVCVCVCVGDTRPCDALIREGHGATLLIHEATFEPDLHHQVCGSPLHAYARFSLPCTTDPSSCGHAPLFCFAGRG